MNSREAFEKTLGSTLNAAEKEILYRKTSKGTYVLIEVEQHFERFDRAWNAALCAAKQGVEIDGKRFVLVAEGPDEKMAIAGRKALAVVAERMETAKLLAVSSVDFWQRVGHQPANEIFAAMLTAAKEQQT